MISALKLGQSSTRFANQLGFCSIIYCTLLEDLNTLLNFVLLTSLMSLLLLYPKPYGTDVLSFNLTPCCHASIPYTTGFDIKINHPRIQTTGLHESCCHHDCKHCHYCNVDFVLFHNVTCDTNSL